ncbi:MAG: SAM hydroxide adenosyltransferase [Planctomycetota bacterium]
MVEGRALPPGRQELPLSGSYEDVDRGEPLALRGSSGYLEISLRDGDAGGKRSLSPGDRVRWISREISEGDGSTARESTNGEA